MNADERGWSEADQRYVADYLGREPKGVIGVAARDKAGRPSVIMNQPLIREGQKLLPFPTLYWLVDPKLSSTIADLERKGGVKQMEQILQEDSSLYEQHLEDNRRYAESRWALLSDADQALVEKHGLAKVLRESGIGGVANYEAVKCLDAQLAYHLTNGDEGSTVGRLLKERYAISL